MKLSRQARLGIALGTITIAFACAEPTTAVPSNKLQPTGPRWSSLSPTLVECPTTTTSHATGLITPLGGTVSAGTASISIPAGAVLVPTTIDVTVPASQYMEIDITANGANHFQFQSPVTVAIDYSRCTRADIDKAPLSVWYIDSSTKALLQDMGGTDDKTARVITFETPHLSGYAVAN